MFDMNRYDFISNHFYGCPQKLCRSDFGNCSIRSHSVRLRAIMSRNAWHDIHRESFFPIWNCQYFKLYWLYPRRKIWSDIVIVTYSIGWDELSTDNKSISRMKGYQYPIDFKFGWGAQNCKTNKLNGLDLPNCVAIIWLPYRIRTE